MLKLEHLVKEFPIRGSKAVVCAVNDVSFEVGPGETLGLVGESGSGKTTVGLCLLRLTEPTSGAIRFRGTDLATLPKKSLRALRPSIQMVFQEPFLSLNPRKSAGATIEEPLILQRKLSRTERRDRLLEVLRQVRLKPEHLNMYPHQLTAGQQQCVGIARAMATKPDFVVLDEPTSSLDPSVRAEIIDLLREIQLDTGVSYLFISHDLTTVQYISHRVAVMYLGRIVEIGTTHEIFKRQLHPYTRALLSSVLVPDPTSKLHMIPLEGEIPSPINLPSGCYLASRCPHVLPSCTQAIPELRTVDGSTSAAACFRAEELLSTSDSEFVPDAGSSR